MFLTRRQILHSIVFLPFAADTLLSAASAHDFTRQSVSQSASTTALDEYVIRRMGELNIPGISLAVLRDGSPLFMKGYGFADRENNVRVTPETPFEIASVSKQFFASAILILVQEGKLSLDDHASQYLQGTPESWKAITLRQLLSHTAGLVREAPGFNWKKRQPDADVIHSAYGLPLIAEPGAKWLYSNLGYFMVAEILRVVSGVSWAQFIHDRIFVPAGMTKTFTTADDISGRAVGYRYGVGRLVDSNYVALRPSGAFVSTVIDFARWDAVLRSGNLLTDTSHRALWTKTRLNDQTTVPYGLGWSLNSKGGRRQAVHDGSDPGFNSYFIHSIDDGISVVLFANSDKAEPKAIAEEVARLQNAESACQLYTEGWHTP